MTERNACGYRSETVAAEYETDQALRDADAGTDDPYFQAAWRAESELRADDWAWLSEQREGTT